MFLYEICGNFWNTNLSRCYLAEKVKGKKTAGSEPKHSGVIGNLLSDFKSL